MTLDTYGCVHNVQKFEINILRNGDITSFNFLSPNAHAYSIHVHFPPVSYKPLIDISPYKSIHNLYT